MPAPIAALLGFCLALLVPPFACANDFVHPIQVAAPDQNHSALIQEVQAAIGKAGYPHINSLCLAGAHDEFGLNVKLGRFAAGPPTIRIHRYLRRLTAGQSLLLTGDHYEG